MKSQKGITLVTLAITVIVMSILAGVATYSGLETIKDTKKTAFISEIEIIQAKVNVIYEKRKTSQAEKNYYDHLGQSADILSTSTLSTILGETPEDGFRFFSKQDLKALNLENINQEVLINFDTREVVSVTGIEIDGTIYYKIQDIPNYTGYTVWK